LSLEKPQQQWLVSLLVESTDQIVWCRGGCGHLDFASGFDANPLGGFTKTDFFKDVLVHLGWAILDCGSSFNPPSWIKARKRIWLSLVLAWRCGPAVDGCGLNGGHRISRSCNKVKANGMCAQDLMNA